MGFSERLKELREKRGLSQEQIADVLDIPRSSITIYENSNDRLPRRQRLEQIADYFDVTVDYLLGRDQKASNRENNVSDIAPEEREFLEWVKNNLTGAFFYDFDKSPEDSKKHMMDTLRLVWERERGRKPGQKQGE